jgi:hypothetical protein
MNKEEDLSFTLTMNDLQILTTISQLNFFRWAIKNKVIDYVIKHKDAIKKDMDQVYKSKVKPIPVVVNKRPKAIIQTTIKPRTKSLVKNTKRVVIKLN